MIDHASEISVRRPARRSTRFRAQVEALDARQLLAAGVSGQVFGLTGIAGQSVASTNGNSSGAGDVTLVRLVGADALSPVGVVASVDYGDGSPIRAAVVTAADETTGILADDLLISVPDHTYSTPGTYTITIAVVEPGDIAPTIFTNPIIVRAPALPLTGDAVDAVKAYGPGPILAAPTHTPTFAGSTVPGVTVVVTAANVLDRSAVAVVGTAVADPTGHWSVTSAPLADGAYDVAVTATGPYGSTATLPLAGSGSSYTLLAIETVGPTVTNFRITDARKAIFAISFTDQFGVGGSGLTRPGTYIVRRTSPTPGKGQTFTATDVASELPLGTKSGNPYTYVIVTGRLVAGKKTLPNGTYTLTVPAALVANAAGLALDGEFTGKYPSGDGAAGGDFRVKFTLRNGKASKVLPVAPTKPVKHHA